MHELVTAHAGIVEGRGAGELSAGEVAFDAALIRGEPLASESAQLMAVRSTAARGAFVERNGTKPSGQQVAQPHPEETSGATGLFTLQVCSLSLPVPRIAENTVKRDADRSDR